MLYVFVPFYKPHTIDFLRSLAKQTETSYRLITRDRKQDKIMWTKSVNDFYKESLLNGWNKRAGREPKSE